MTSTVTLSLTWSRKLLCLCGCGAFFAAAYFAHGMMQRSQTDGQLEQTLRDLDEHSPQWRLADLEAARAAVPDDENSARDVERAAELLPPDWSNLLGRRLIYPLSRTPDAFDPGEQRAVRTELQRYAAALTAAQPLADKPRGRHALVLTRQPWLMPLSHTQQVAQVVHLLTLDALARAEAGDHEGAARSCRAALNAARSLGDEPFLVSQLMRKDQDVVAARGVQHLLNHGVCAPDTLAELQRRLEAEADHPAFFIGLRGHRALIQATLQAIEASEVPWQQLFPKAPAAPQNWLAPPTLDEVRRQHAALLSFCGRAVDAAELPAPQRAERLRELQPEVDGGDFPLLEFLVRPLPALEQHIAARDAHLRCTAAAVAAERYRQAHGCWPASLSDLAPAYLQETPLDPADGAPLHYERRADGMVIASRCLDEHGRTYHAADPTGRQGVAVRLWDVSQRGRPKPPV